MAQRGLCLALEFLDNTLGQYFAKFHVHAPLVERVDIPDGPVGEDDVIVS
jgi:hypothetical protein